MASLRPLVQGLSVLKVVPAWGLPWTPALRHEAARLCPSLVVRTVAGDPSAGQPFPLPDAVIAELRPWWEARDPASPFWIELGNEPLIAERPEVYAWEWQYWLDKAISACRVAFPSARLIAPAHLLNHPVALGSHPDGVSRFIEICADTYRRCDAVGVHAYTLAQWERGRALVRQHVGPKPLWITEFALNEALPPAVRGAAYRRTLEGLDAEAALLYHVAQLPGADPTHFNPNYQVTREVVEHLLAEPATPMTLTSLNIIDLRPRLPVIRDRVPRPRTGKPTTITLHYNGPAVRGAGDPDAELRQIIAVDAPWHQQNPNIRGDSLQYHLCVLSDGTIYQTRDLGLPASHAGHAEANRSSIAVHLPLGGLQDATAAQWRATEALFAALVAEYGMRGGRAAVRGHQEWKATECPGPRLMPRLVAWREGVAPTGAFYRIRADVPAANVREGPGTRFPVALGGKAKMYPGDVLDADAITQGDPVGGDPAWAHRRDGVGFVHMSLLEVL
jgi:hypothetical protein